MLIFDDKGRLADGLEIDEDHFDVLAFGNYAITDESVSFDDNDVGVSIAMVKDSRGFYEWSHGHNRYSGIRGDSGTHVVVTGNRVWDGEESAFILVLPKHRKT